MSLENWDDIWRRNQFLCAAYARRFPQNKILFVGLPRDVSHQLRRGTLRQLRDEATWTVADIPNITITRPLKLFPNRLSGGRILNEAISRAHIRREARRLGLDRPILWLNPHDAVHMAGRMNERAVIYDITDDWISPTQSAATSRRIAAQDAALCSRADAVIVCSQRLFDMKRGVARNLHLIPNGVDASHYERILDGAGPLCAEAAEWPRPVLGYTGTLHAERVDVGLIEALAARMQKGCLVLIGPNFLPAEVSARWRAMPNVFLLGPKPYQQLPELMRAFDVCITPHKVTIFTESLNPIKLWEYLAAGKPIVSTAVAGFRDYPQFVQIADGADGFLAAAQGALCEPPGIAQARREEARRHSWEARLDEVTAVLASCTNQTVKGTGDGL